MDLWVFGGSFLLGAALILVGGLLGILQSPLPLGAWLLLVVAVDVTHVHATWLRTYFDPDEIRRHPARYALVPLLAYALGVWAHGQGSLVFWRMLAYLAVFHFVRQQYGWVALYGRKEVARKRLDRWLDAGAIYAATLWPLLWWHAHLPRRFSWFVAGDFAGTVSQGMVAAALPVYAALLLAFAMRQFWRWRRERFLPAGKSLLVASTAAGWWISIVGLDSDWAFTALNVLPHGIPYVALVWQRSAAEPRRRGAAGALLRAGPLPFAALLLALGYGEEWLWDLGIWHDHPDLFGASWKLTGTAQALLVPLLALPQAVHYCLDGFIWRRGEGPAAPSPASTLLPSGRS
jgi:hypothetical protein